MLMRLFSSSDKHSLQKIRSQHLVQVNLVINQYKNVFLIKSINKLSLHENHDHAIEITATLSYESLYNLLNTELMTLK